MSKKDAIRIALVIMGFVIVALLTMSSYLQKIDRTQIIIDDYQFDVYVAQTSLEHTQGLSNIDLTEFDADGMLFVFDDSTQRTFWMKDMEFSIDIIWIQDGWIVKTEENVPAPKDQNVRYMHSEPFEVNAVLEFPAGTVDKYGIDSNQKVRF